MCYYAHYYRTCTDTHTHYYNMLYSIMLPEKLRRPEEHAAARPRRQLAPPPVLARFPGLVLFVVAFLCYVCLLSMCLLVCCCFLFACSRFPRLSGLVRAARSRTAERDPGWLLDRSGAAGSEPPPDSVTFLLAAYRFVQPPTSCHREICPLPLSTFRGPRLRSSLLSAPCRLPPRGSYLNRPAASRDRRDRCAGVGRPERGITLF